MTTKEPKTARGRDRKGETGDGRKSTAGEKFAREDKRVSRGLDKAVTGRRRK